MSESQSPAPTSGDESGDVVNAYRYDPWGTLLDSSEHVASPYRYASYRFDGSTGLSYCWNRYYAPALGRFLTRDIYPGETSDPVTMNPYLYCGGDPVNRVDPSGMSWKSAAALLTVAAVVVGAVGVLATVATLGAAGPMAALVVGAISGGAGAAWGYAAAEANAQAYAHGEMSPWEFYTSQSCNQLSIQASIVSAGGRELSALRRLGTHVGLHIPM